MCVNPKVKEILFKFKLNLSKFLLGGKHNFFILRRGQIHPFLSIPTTIRVIFEDLFSHSKKISG